MEYVALDSLVVSSVRWRTEAGAHNLTVIAKATFDLVHDETARLVEPYPLFGDLFYEENETRSLRVASDFALRKPRADILFTGGVYAPVGQRVTERKVRLAVTGFGGAQVLDKTIVAIGARDKDEQGNTTAPAAFGYLPLRYELAYGGATSKSNPVGVGADPGDPRLPSLLHPTQPKLVAGLGPVPATWWWRSRALAGTDPRGWLGGASPTLPPAVDLAFFNAAPPDQQVASLRGDEQIFMAGLHPTIEELRSKLPGMRAHARVELGGAPHDVKLALDTMWIEGDTMKCTLTWRGALALDAAMAAAVDGGKVTATLAKGDAPPSWDRGADAAKPAKKKRGFADMPSSIDMEMHRPAPVLKGRAAQAARPDPPARTTPRPPIVSTTKMHVFTIPWQVKPPEDAYVVVVKGTFDVGDDGTVKLADEQPPPSGDVYNDPEPGSDQASLRYPSDFALFKPASDVILVGHAYPAGKEKTLAHVELRFGDLRRSVAVFGDRRWGSIGHLAAAPFEKMPLTWERAMGSALSEANPVGRGWKSNVMLPNLERPEALVTSKDARPPPACFAPIAPLWKSRRSKLGTYDARWLRSRWPFLPVDFDWSHFNAAPLEQQVPYLRGDEKFVVTGVRPGGASIGGRLPDVRPRVFAQRTKEAGGDFFEVLLRLDTAWIDADAKKLVLVWRGVFNTTDDDAPEISCLFATEEPYKAPLPIAKAQDRLFAELAAAGMVPLTMLAFADEPPFANDTRALPAAPPPPPRDAILAKIARGEPLAGIDLSGVSLENAVLRGANLAGAILLDAKLAGAQLAGANLSGAALARADLDEADLQGADLTKADLTGASLFRAKLGKARLESAVFDRVRAVQADFAGAVMPRASFVRASLEIACFDGAEARAADFTGAVLDRATFKKATLDDARFYGARGERAVFEEAKLVGLRADAATLPRCTFAGADASKSIWETADLTASSFAGAVLAGALFARAKLDEALFNKASCTQAVFRRASLKRARCLRANLMQASLEKADLTGADLRGANLYQSDTWRAKTEGVDLSMANVTGTRLAR